MLVMARLANLQQAAFEAPGTLPLATQEGNFSSCSILNACSAYCDLATCTMRDSEEHLASCHADSCLWTELAKCSSESRIVHVARSNLAVRGMAGISLIRTRATDQSQQHLAASAQ